MTDRYEEMRVSPNPAQAAKLRQLLHARMANVSSDADPRRPHLDLDTARLDPVERVQIKELDVSLNEPTNAGKNRRRVALAAAAVVAVIGVSGIAFAITRSDDDETPSAAAVATIPPPTTVAMETLHFTVEDIPVTLSVPDDWTVLDGWAVYKGLGVGSANLLIDDIANIYTDGCQRVLADPPVGPTVDDLAEAWATVPDLAATAAVDVSVDGYAGKQIEFTVPDYGPTECRDVYAIWHSPGDAAPGYWAQGPNHHFKQWIVDVDGTRLTISAGSFPSTSPQDRAVLEAILASIRIG
jgi:hypothetical protein